MTDAVSQVITLIVLLNDQPYQPSQPLHLGENRVDILAMNGAGLITKRTQTIKMTGEKLYFPIIEAR